jgi:hypothetical protein
MIFLFNQANYFKQLPAYDLYHKYHLYTLMAFSLPHMINVRHVSANHKIETYFFRTSGTLIPIGLSRFSRVGSWQLQAKVYFPATCNKGEYTLMNTSFAIKQKSQAEIMAEQAIKNKQYKRIDGPLPKPGPGPDWQQKPPLPAQQNLQHQQKTH